MEEKTIWYLCDGEKEECKKSNCYKNTKENPCRHTKDINHAVNFKKKIYGNFLEFTQKLEEKKKLPYQEQNDHLS